MVDFEKIKALGNSNLDLLYKLLPNAEKRGNELTCADIFGHKGASFSYNIKSGLWCDFATGISGASVIDLVAVREQCEAKEAALILARMLEISVDGVVTMPDANTPPDNPRKKVIADIAPRTSMPHTIFRDGRNIKLSAIWLYRNDMGLPVAADGRIDLADGKKEVIPFLYNDAKKSWYPKALPKDRPLYQLDLLFEKQDAPVIVGEGCKTAQAIQYYFPNYVATTWQGGCNAVSKADWTPLYGRNVIIIPDADECGRKACEQICIELAKHGTRVRYVDTSEMEIKKKGWDIADALSEGVPQKDVIELVKEHLNTYNGELLQNDVEPSVVVKKRQRVINDYDDTYFKCLGVIGDTHYYYKRQTAQIIELKPNHYDAKHLITLAPLQWWQLAYPARNNVDWLAATDALCRIQERCGVYDSNRIRGRGCWFDEKRAVLHLGDRLFVDGNTIDIDEFETDYYYLRAPALAVKTQTVLPDADAARLIDICRYARWEQPYYGDILAGWIFSALVCGAMPFRSHIYLVGAAGSGKSWILENIVRPIFGNIALSVSSKSTEAGIRDQLGGDIRPVIFDEAEAENQNDRVRMQSIFDLARNGSSENAEAIVKFGSKYLCRSSFLFASINSSMSKVADLSRTAFIRLRSAPYDCSETERITDAQKFERLERETSQLLTPEYCQCLLSRAVQLVPVLRRSHKVVAEVAAKTFGSRRLGDQMAMIIAGLWGLISTEVITPKQAEAYIQSTQMKENKSLMDDSTQEERCLSHLLFAAVEVPTSKGMRKYPLNRLILLCNGSVIDADINKQTLIDYLGMDGIKIYIKGVNNYVALSLNSATLPAEIFKNTEWETGWADSLKRLKNTSVATQVRFAEGVRHKALLLPLKLFKIDEGDL